MKALSIKLIVMAALLAGCSTKPVIVQDQYTKQFTVGGVTDSELFGRAMEWMAVNYVDADEVIRYSNENRGRIIGKGVYEYSYEPFLSNPINGIAHYSVIIDVSSEKVRAAMTPHGSFWGPKIDKNKIITDMKSHFDLMLMDLEVYVTTGGKFAKEAHIWN